MKDIIKEYAEIVSEKTHALEEKSNQREMERRSEQNNIFNKFKDQVRIDNFLSTICSLLDKDNTMVRISVYGKLIIPDERYKEDNRFYQFWGYEQLRTPSFFERMFNSSYWDRKIIQLISEDGEIYQRSWSNHKSPVPLYVVEENGDFKEYRNKLVKFPIKELIQRHGSCSVGTVPIQGDEEITLIISNKKSEKVYPTNLSYRDLGLVLEHQYKDEWTIESTGEPSYEWTKAVLKLEKGENTFIDFLSKVFNEINLNFRVINSEISDFGALKLSLFEISLKEREEKGN